MRRLPNLNGGALAVGVPVVVVWWVFTGGAWSQLATVGYATALAVLWVGALYVIPRALSAVLPKRRKR